MYINRKNTKLKYYFQLNKILYSTYFVLATSLIYFLFPIGKYNVSIANFLLIIYAASIAFAISKNEILNIETIITKGISTIITVTLIIISYISLFSFYESNIVLIFSVILLSIFWTFYGLKIITFLITTAEKKFLKSTIPLNDILIQISKSLSETLDIPNVTACMKAGATDCISKSLLDASLLHKVNLIKDSQRFYLNFFKDLEERDIQYTNEQLNDYAYQDALMRKTIVDDILPIEDSYDFLDKKDEKSLILAEIGLNYI